VDIIDFAKESIMHTGVAMADTKDKVKTSFSHDLPISTIEKFEEIAGKLPGLKWECLDAMIRAFGNMPRYVQIEALNGNYDIKELLRMSDIIDAQKIARKVADAEAPVRPPESHKRGL
jgi:hypothetical protein